MNGFSTASEYGAADFSPAGTSPSATRRGGPGADTPQRRCYLIRMARQLFVNLPVRDLDKTVEFFTALGFAFN
ncbi:MAG TPA: hypothetical protein VLT34_01075, partial [Arthrobacter sp.]|nr:hypothetical protein [Arthrobacter sp.]